MQQAGGLATLTLVQTSSQTVVYLSMTNTDGLLFPTSITLPPFEVEDGVAQAKAIGNLDGNVATWTLMLNSAGQPALVGLSIDADDVYSGVVDWSRCAELATLLPIPERDGARISLSTMESKAAHCSIVAPGESCESGIPGNLCSKAIPFPPYRLKG